MAANNTSNSADACPVDHTARTAWLDAARKSGTAPSIGGGTASEAPVAPHPIAPGSTADACPVDHTARQTWLDAARKSNPSNTTTTTTTTTQSPGAPTGPPASPSTTCDSSSLNPTIPPQDLPASLSPVREISTIPRAIPSNQQSSPSPSSQNPNNEGDLPPHTSPDGRWIYPSEQMFFAAMRRKSFTPDARDMPHIVPIHNAVNERAWAEIKAWEAGRGAEQCGGPKLVSFAGDASKLTPKARMLMLLGYSRPFDRHDWTVDRCGRRVEYVIDFYTGKRDARRPEAVSFYLDVRPKVNSLEGVKMRVERWLGSWFE